MTNIKIIEKKGKFLGKKIVILVGVHGNEICGVEALNKLIPKINIDSGKVTFIYANLEAIKQNKRFVEANLNRCFLKDQSEEIRDTLEGKTAKEIIPYLEKADLVLDVHASFSEDSFPFLICDKKNIKFAQGLPGELISYNWDEFEPGSTDYFMHIQDKIGICIECGYLKDKKTKEIAIQVILNFLILVGAIKGDLKNIKEKRIIKLVNLYKNKYGKFKKTRNFADFEKLKEKTLIGYDGEVPVFVEKNKLLLLVRDMEDLGDECFIVAEEIKE